MGAGAGIGAGAGAGGFRILPAVFQALSSEIANELPVVGEKYCERKAVFPALAADAIVTGE
jgi:hypothetical protein